MMGIPIVWCSIWASGRAGRILLILPRASFNKCCAICPVVSSAPDTSRQFTGTCLGSEFASTAAQWFTTKEAVRTCKPRQRIGQQVMNKTHQAIQVLAHFRSCQVAIARAVNTRFSECTGALMNSMTIDEEVCVLLCAAAVD